MRAPRSLAVLIGLLALALPALAFAQGAPGVSPVSVGADEISLKNGGMLRGTIITIEPERQVVILLAPAGESRAVPWAEVDKVERGKYAPLPAPLPVVPAPPPLPTPPPDGAAGSPGPRAPAEPSAPSPPARPTPEAGIPYIHIEADKTGVVLRRITYVLDVVGYNLNARGTATEVVCGAPCDQRVDGRGGQEFFIGGDGVSPSDTFSLSGVRGEVTLKVSAGGAAPRTAGMILSLGGGSAALAGAILLPVVAVTPDDASAPSRSGISTSAVAGVIIGVGVAMFIPGIILWTKNRTSYTLKPRPASASGLRFSNGALLF